MSLLLVALVCLAAVAVGVVHAELASGVADALRTSKEIYVATRRADGSMSKKVPVWFMFDGEHVYSASAPTAYKVRRIKRGSPLLVWVGGADGPHFVGRAEIVNDPELAARMAPVYSQKYWIAWVGLFRPDPERVRTGKTVLIKITPESTP